MQGMRERIGILGGTFQPIHNGHLALARHAMEALSLTRVLFVIDRIPPHKSLNDGATTAQRLQLLELALHAEEGFFAETMELQREGASYTVDTLRALKERTPDAALFFLMGSDMLRSFPSWRAPQEIADLAVLVCTTREGHDAEEQASAQRCRAQFGARVVLLPAVSPISSTEIRTRIAQALPIDGMTPPAVAAEIYYLGLYQPSDILTYYNEVRAALSEKRMRHTAGVIETAIRLAAENGVDGKQARLAALLHDCAKELPPEQLLLYSDTEEPILPILHAYAGADLARTKYGVTDEAVLRAIRLHTTGDAHMTKLDKILYLADMIEPSRTFAGVSEIRMEKSLDDAILLAFQRSIWYIQSHNGRVHPATRRAISDLEATNGRTIRRTASPEDL